MSVHSSLRELSSFYTGVPQASQEWCRPRAAPSGGPRKLRELFYERTVGFQDVLLREPQRIDPLQALTVERGRLPGIARHDPEGELDETILVGMRETHQSPAGAKFHTELLFQLSRERL